ncbi:MAG: hypothetical protein LBG62_04510 [Candidatus Methanoplasma sp.]|nr:hypothetical protein [Candidatus Methanoplasma sp.]
MSAVGEAEALSEKGDHAAAAALLKSRLESDPGDAEAEMALARICVYGLKDRERGIAILKGAAERRPGDAGVLKALATVLAMDKRRRAEADAAYRRLAEEFPDAGVLGAYAVFARIQMLDFERSAELHEAAIALSPGDGRLHRNYAVLLLNDLRDYERARAELEEAVRLDPGDEASARNLKLLMERKFDPEGNLKPRRRLFGR